eukprot:6479678-Amphidinium_carterae.2
MFLAGPNEVIGQVMYGILWEAPGAESYVCSPMPDLLGEATKVLCFLAWLHHFGNTENSLDSTRENRRFLETGSALLK